MAIIVESDRLIIRTWMSEEDKEQAILNYGLNVLQLPVVYSIINPQGDRSSRVAQRLGMVSVGKTTRFYNTELEIFALEADRWWQATTLF
jgi:RimJ/RimL family protein N-acetyltransferase